MTSDSDDALTWAGDEGTPPSKAALPQGWNAVGKGSEQVGHLDGDGTVVTAEERLPMSTAMLLVLGVLGGVYLLYTLGWVVGGLRLRPLASLIVADAMYLPWLVLAIAVPALWFLTVCVLTRGKAAWIRVALLLLGVVMFVPWPFVTVGVIGS